MATARTPLSRDVILAAAIDRADADLQLEKHPTVARLWSALTQYDPDAELEQALEQHLDQLDTQLSEQPRPRPYSVRGEGLLL